MQVSRLLNSLHSPTVLVCADYEDRTDRSDATLQSDSNNSVLKCLRVPFEFSTWHRMLARVSSRLSLPIAHKTPDAYTSWGARVTESVADVISQGQRFDLMVTFGAPMSDHLIGLKLKKRFGLPWVAHFSDPWVDNPFTSSDPLTNAVNRSLESKVLSVADRVIFTSQETIDLVFRKYPAVLKTKARVLPHAFDERLFVNAENARESKITIRYLGDFYGPRTPKPLFEALRQLRELNPSLLTNLHFELIGNFARQASGTGILEDLPADLVSVKSPVGYLESLSLMSSSDGLLVIDAPAANSVFLPSKLIDYIGSKRPIFGISPSGTAAKLIGELGGWVADPGDPIAVREQLSAFIQFLRQARTERDTSWGRTEVRERFEISAVSRMFSEIVEEVDS